MAQTLLSGMTAQGHVGQPHGDRLQGAGGCPPAVAAVPGLSWHPQGLGGTPALRTRRPRLGQLPAQRASALERDAVPGRSQPEQPAGLGQDENRPLHAQAVLRTAGCFPPRQGHAAGIPSSSCCCCCPNAGGARVVRLPGGGHSGLGAHAHPCLCLPGRDGGYWLTKGRPLKASDVTKSPPMCEPEGSAPSRPHLPHVHSSRVRASRVHASRVRASRVRASHWPTDQHQPQPPRSCHVTAGARGLQGPTGEQPS